MAVFLFKTVVEDGLHGLRVSKKKKKKNHRVSDPEPRHKADDHMTHCKPDKKTSCLHGTL